MQAFRYWWSAGPYGTEMARRLRVAGGNAQFQPLGGIAARHAARVFAAHPGARSVARHGIDRPFGLPDAPHGSGPGLLRAGARDAVAVPRGAHAVARPYGDARRDDRIRGAAYAVAHVLPALAAAHRGAARPDPYAAARAERARRGVVAGRRRLRSGDGLSPSEPPGRARPRALRHADARHRSDQPVLRARQGRPTALHVARHVGRANTLSLVHAECLSGAHDRGDLCDGARPPLPRTRV